MVLGHLLCRVLGFVRDPLDPLLGPLHEGVVGLADAILWGVVKG